MHTAVCILQQSRTLQCLSHRGVELCIMHPTEESDSAVDISLQSPALRHASYHGVIEEGFI